MASPQQPIAVFDSELVVQDIDTLILGCTHYPLLIPVLEKVVGNGIRIVDSAETKAKYTADST